MRENNMKFKKNNEKGITLVALIITVAVLLIIAGISINAGTESIYNTRLKGFYTQLEIIQKRVDDIVSTNEGYYETISGTKTYFDIKTQTGELLNEDQKDLLKRILANTEGFSSISEDELNKFINKFRYYTTVDLEEQLGLSEMEYSVFIHFDTRTIISETGIKVKGEENLKHTLEKNGTYFVKQETNENKETKSLECSASVYGTSNYKITVTPVNLETTGTLKYKETTSKYWETADGLEIVVNKLTKYNIEYVDSKKNTVSETITLSLDRNSIIVTVD